MPATTIAGATALVTGASRGFGRGIATSLVAAGAQVVGVARDKDQLSQLREELGGSFTGVTADAAAPETAGRLIDAYRPAILVLNAGAAPLPRPLHQHTWQTFSMNWDVDVQHAFRWVREALLRPLDPGSRVITVSSGAALRGSPLSGGYAGAKAAIRFLTAYAADESQRAAPWHHVPLRAAAADPGHRARLGRRRRLRRPGGPGRRRLPARRGPGAHHRAGRRGGHQPGHRSRLRQGRLPAHRGGADAGAVIR